MMPTRRWRQDILERLFLQHPRSVGESYGKHLYVAGRFGITMILAGLAGLVHALIPGLYVTTGSDTVKRLHDRMVLNRKQHRDPRQQSLDVLSE